MLTAKTCFDFLSDFNYLYMAKFSITSYDHTQRFLKPFTVGILMSRQKKRVYIETYGCQMNVADSEVVLSLMGNDNYEVSNSLEHADVVLVNTCSVRENAEQRVSGRLSFGLRIHSLHDQRQCAGQGREPVILLALP